MSTAMTLRARRRRCCRCAGPSLRSPGVPGTPPPPGGLPLPPGGEGTTSSASTSAPVSALYTSGGERAQRPVRAEYQAIGSIFFGGEGWFSSYADWFEAHQKRRQAYYDQGYYGPVPYCLFDGVDNTRIECGQ